MVASTTATVTTVTDIKADTGAVEISITTRAVNRVNVTNIHNVYNTTVVNNVTVNRVSYNGGNGGINARPTAAQEAAVRERHIRCHLRTDAA